MPIPRFTLRTLLIAVAVCAVGAWWVTSRLAWIEERRAFRESQPHMMRLLSLPKRWPTAPGGLWLFGDIAVYGWSEGDHGLNESAVVEARRLFPESVYHNAAEGWHR